MDTLKGNQSWNSGNMFTIYQPIDIHQKPNSDPNLSPQTGGREVGNQLSITPGMIFKHTSYLGICQHSFVE